MSLDALTSLSSNLWYIGFPLWVGYWYFRRRLHPQTAATLVTVAAMFLVPSYVLQFAYYVSAPGIGAWRYPNCGLQVLQLIVVIWAVWDAWRRWKGKKKAFKALGNKGRALLAKLLGNLRDNLQPAPVPLRNFNA